MVRAATWDVRDPPLTPLPATPGAAEAAPPVTVLEAVVSARGLAGSLLERAAAAGLAGPEGGSSTVLAAEASSTPTKLAGGATDRERKTKFWPVGVVAAGGFAG